MGILHRLRNVMASREAETLEPAVGSSSNNRDRREFSSSPELMCGIKPGMKKEEIKRHLARLFRRHNRAAPSLDQIRRREAEMMLDAIVICRQKYVDRS